MHAFQKLIYDRFSESITAWDTVSCPDIYAISLLYGTGWSSDAAGQEVAVQAQVSLSFNTLTHYEAQIVMASSAEEAKWNFAFWLQNITATVPHDFPYGGNPPIADLELRDAWCASLGILPDGTDGGGRPTYDEPTLYEAIRIACQRVAQMLHQEGIILDKLGRTVPIVIHELETTPSSAAATRAANPPGLSREAEEWQLGRTYDQIATYETLLREISMRTVAEQARFWANLLVDLTLKRPSELATRMIAMKRTEFDIQPLLAATGPEAIPILIPLIEEYAIQEQYHLRSVHPLIRDGKWTESNWLTSYALHVVREIGVADDAQVDRLYILLLHLYQDSLGKDWVGTNLAGLASTLHRLCPNRFSPPRIGSRDNKLLNPIEFGISEELKAMVAE